VIFGIGNDIIEISRIGRACERTGFLGRVFSENELSCYQKSGLRIESLAGNFAAKEAFSKALGIGVRAFRLIEVEILRDELGRPYINLSGKAADIVMKLGVQSLHVSISHCKDYATAIVVAEKE